MGFDQSVIIEAHHRETEGIAVFMHCEITIIEAQALKSDATRRKHLEKAKERSELAQEAFLAFLLRFERRGSSQTV
jgi:hypothetical protein